MKLATTQVRKVEEQLGAQALPEQNPIVPKLTELFGEHTFFLDNTGLNIVASSDEVAGRDGDGNVMKLASWNEDRKQLRVHEPQVLPVVVEVSPEKPNGAE